VQLGGRRNRRKGRVGHTTVQTTMHEARRLGHLTILRASQAGKKNLTNIVRISFSGMAGLVETCVI
jgi:hypothetical protein